MTGPERREQRAFEDLVLALQKALKEETRRGAVVERDLEPPLELTTEKVTEAPTPEPLPIEPPLVELPQSEPPLAPSLTPLILSEPWEEVTMTPPEPAVPPSSPPGRRLPPTTVPAPPVRIEERAFPPEDRRASEKLRIRRKLLKLVGYGGAAVGLAYLWSRVVSWANRQAVWSDEEGKPRDLMGALDDFLRGDEVSRQEVERALANLVALENAALENPELTTALETLFPLLKLPPNMVPEEIHAFSSSRPKPDNVFPSSTADFIYIDGGYPLEGRPHIGWDGEVHQYGGAEELSVGEEKFSAYKIVDAEGLCALNFASIATFYRDTWHNATTEEMRDDPERRFHIIMEIDGEREVWSVGEFFEKFGPFTATMEESGGGFLCHYRFLAKKGLKIWLTDEPGLRAHKVWFNFAVAKYDENKYREDYDYVPGFVPDSLLGPFLENARGLMEFLKKHPEKLPLLNYARTFQEDEHDLSSFVPGGEHRIIIEDDRSIVGFKFVIDKGILGRIDDFVLELHYRDGTTAEFPARYLCGSVIRDTSKVQEYHYLMGGIKKEGQFFYENLPMSGVIEVVLKNKGEGKLSARAFVQTAATKELPKSLQNLKLVLDIRHQDSGPADMIVFTPSSPFTPEEKDMGICAGYLFAIHRATLTERFEEEHGDWGWLCNCEADPGYFVIDEKNGVYYIRKAGDLTGSEDTIAATYNAHDEEANMGKGTPPFGGFSGCKLSKTQVSMISKLLMPHGKNFFGLWRVGETISESLSMTTIAYRYLPLDYREPDINQLRDAYYASGDVREKLAGIVDGLDFFPPTDIREHVIALNIKNILSHPERPLTLDQLEYLDKAYKFYEQAFSQGFPDKNQNPRTFARQKELVFRAVPFDRLLSELAFGVIT